MTTQILALDKTGYPIRWASPERVTFWYATRRVLWSAGEHIARLRGGVNREGVQSVLNIPAVVALRGRWKRHEQVPVSNRALFLRDCFTCLYCGEHFSKHDLTRDHIVPRSRGGSDSWENLATACKRCNRHKANRTARELGLELIALPYAPNPAEYLYLLAQGRIREDQSDFLAAHIRNQQVAVDRRALRAAPEPR